MVNELKEFWRYRSVVDNFVRTTLAVRYRRSVLGYFWSVLSPLLKYAILGVVFEVIGRFAMPNYYGYMFVGSVFFGFVSAAVQKATTAFILNENYIKKIYVPKLVFVMNYVLLETVNFLLVMASILVLLLVTGQGTMGWTWLFFPVSLVITMVFLTGLSALLAVATLYFRDLQHLVEILIQALLFGTPILYPAWVLQKDPLLAQLLVFNPLVYFVDLVREPLVFDRLPSPLTMAVCVGLAVIFFFAGLATLMKFNNRIIFKL